MGSSSCPERRYWLRTEGFDGYELRAPTAGAAKWRSFQSYDEAGYGRIHGEYLTQSDRFKRFLERTICHALGPVSDPPAQEGNDHE